MDVVRGSKEKEGKVKTQIKLVRIRASPKKRARRKLLQSRARPVEPSLKGVRS